MTLWQVGDAFLVGAPAEPYSAFQVELRRRFPDHAIIMLNIVNGNVGYLAPAETYDKPGLYQIKISAVPAWLHGAGDRRHRQHPQAA